MTALMYGREELVDVAKRVLALDPDPIPRFRLIRDVLGGTPGDAEFEDAQSCLTDSKWVKLLENAQYIDGTWGRYHTQDTKVKQPIPTTEVALAMALDSGLDAGSKVIRRLMPTLIDYVKGAYIWPDWAEKHDNPDAWPIWVRHYSAAALAQIDRFHPLLDEFWEIRSESVIAAFAGGTYDRQAEIDVLVKLLNCRMKNPVAFRAVHSLRVLGATKNRLPEQTERDMLLYLRKSPVGIYYVNNRSLDELPEMDDRSFWPFIAAHKVLAGFPLWKDLSTGILNAIWEQRDEDGFWVSDASVSRKPFSCFPLSESWRRRINRTIDMTTVLLGFLAQGLPPA